MQTEEGGQIRLPGSESLSSRDYSATSQCELKQDYFNHKCKSIVDTAQCTIMKPVRFIGTN